MTFHPSRQPYYTAVAAFMACYAVIALGNNTAGAGWGSDWAFAQLCCAAALCAWSIYFILHSTMADEATLAFGGLQLGKPVYYFSVLALTALRATQAFEMNHTLSGFGSLWGLVWLAAAAAIAVWTWFNYQSYQKALPAAHAPFGR